MTPTPAPNSTTQAARAGQVILRAAGLQKTFRLGGEDLHILRGVDMQVAAGEWVAVLGASGSGKSTLLHLLGGLDRPTQGAVEFAGQDVFAQGAGFVDRYRNQRVGFVFQFYHLLPEFTALENVVMSAMIRHGPLGWLGKHSAVRERAAALLEKMGLQERLKHRPAKLSGGERQRVAIARALINGPQILLADEPTGNLDAETGQGILELLRGLHQDGQTIVMVTHDTAIAAAADRRLRLREGRIVE